MSKIDTLILAFEEEQNTTKANGETYVASMWEEADAMTGYLLSPRRLPECI